MNPITDVGRVEIKRKARRLFFTPSFLTANIVLVYQARDLAAKDIGGKSDPFCIIELDSNRLRTHTIYKTLDPAWNKTFVIPVQDIHSVIDISVYDEDTNKSNEFIGKVAIPLLAVREPVSGGKRIVNFSFQIKNGEKKWMALKDRKCLVPVKGAIEIEATLVYTNVRQRDRLLR